MMTRVFSMLLVFSAHSVACSPSRSSGPPPSSSAGGGSAERPIDWQPYSERVFEEAARSGKWVLLDVGIEGCTACRWMLEDTYAHPEVIARIRQHFIAVAVDASARPDIGERYARWAWPATIVLTAEGEQILAIRGNKRPQNFLPILDRLIARAPDVETDAEEATPIGADTACHATLARLDRVRREQGGWGRGRLRAVQSPLEQYAFAHSANRNHALSTAENYTLLLDPVWGGVFVGSLGDWDHPIVEKRLENQAGALMAFASAYATTGDEQWLSFAREVDRYIETFLLSPEGGFYASQRDEAPGLMASMSPSEYFQLPDEERRRYGTPLVDQGVYAALHARAVEAYARLAELSDDERFAARARRAGDLLLSQVREGVVAQTLVAPEGPRLRSAEASIAGPVLETQARTGLALVALYDLFDDARYLEAAEAVGEATRRLSSPEGGLLSAPSGGMLPARRPIEANAIAARLFYALVDRSHERSFEQDAVGALAYAERFVTNASLNALGELALAHRARNVGLVDVSIAGPADDSAQALLRAGRSGYVADRRAHLDTGGRYPSLEQAGAFVCTRSSCSRPILDPAELVEAVHQTNELATCRL